jgi:Intracellular proteinase inhibitor
MRRSMISGYGWLGGVLLISGFVIGCRLPPAGQEVGAAAPSGISDVSLPLKATKPVYAQGESLDLTLEVVNHSRRMVTLGFRTAQRYDFVIQNAQGQEVWRWSAEQMFAQMVGLETISADGGKLTYRTVVRERFVGGVYTVIGIVAAGEARMSARIEITIH